MISCQHVRESLHAYIDGEVAQEDRLAFEEHFLECAECNACYQSTEQIVDAVREARPLYPTASSLRAKVLEVFEDYQLIKQKRKHLRLAIATLSLAAAFLLFAFLPGFHSPAFTTFAATTHHHFASGDLSLAISSNDPVQVTRWLGQNLPFAFALPNFPVESGEPKSYSLVGARLTQYDGHPVAYLAYRMNGRPISLLVGSAAGIKVSAGQTFQSGNLQFHFSSDEGLKVITWEDRGLSYALISDVQVEGAQSCVVCHGSHAERRKFEKLSRVTSGN